MRSLLYAVSAVALVGFGASAHAADLDDSSVNVLNIAVNVVPGNLINPSDNPAINGSINIGARFGGSVGHQGWHPDLDLDVTQTMAVGAVNQVETFIGRDNFASQESLSGGGFFGAEEFSVGDITHVDVHQEGLFTDQGAHVFSVDGVDYWAARGGLAFEMTDDFSGSFVPETNVVNAAINLENINGSANYYAGLGSQVGNIGALSTTAIGALNVSTTTIGVPGTLGDLGLGD